MVYLKKLGLELGDHIGRGAFAKVYAGRFRGFPVAVKWVPLPADPTERKKLLTYLRREMQALNELHHPGIVTCRHVHETIKVVAFILDKCSGGTLGELIHKRALKPHEVTEKKVKKVFRQVAEALSYCHQKMVAHRDLKPSNIMLDGSGHAKLIDFGVTVKGRHMTRTYCGTMQWMAPEVMVTLLTGQPYNPFAGDAYSFGVMLLYASLGSLPFSHEAKEAYKQKTNPTFVKATLNSLHPDSSSPTPLAKLVARLLVKEEERMLVQDIPTHAWFLRQ